jgi:hypothetical protein
MVVAGITLKMIAGNTLVSNTLYMVVAGITLKIIAGITLEKEIQPFLSG